MVAASERFRTRHAPRARTQYLREVSVALGQDSSRLEGELARLLAELAGTTMPFGKYGPQHYPPQGVPLVDLPYEYLVWFSRTGFPKGRLGDLLRFVYHAKQDGADAMFEPIRAVRGGRANLRHAPRRRWSFADDERPAES